ncbi:MAG: PhzF family phenazine biosynthesis protein [Desulfitobacterium hafniense]|nr:PhzF family phenazine biosynthesis protein [Desulfitobacterium hafniense]
MSISIYQVDAFTEKAFKGNPAGVCILAEEKSETWMQAVANEMNLSETAFLYKQDGYFDLCWFTPTVEVDLCGHATLASAHILWEMGYLNKREEARFQTKSGLLTAKLDSDWILLDFPAEPSSEATAPDFITEALKASPVYSGKNRMDYIFELESEEAVKNLEPHLNLLKELDCRGIIVTSRSNSDEYDFVSRFFGPRAGVDEDPVTGSAHCCLGTYWQERLGKSELVGYQASARGGMVKVKVVGDRVILAGKAVTVLKGELFG